MGLALDCILVEEGTDDQRDQLFIEPPHAL